MDMTSNKTFQEIKRDLETQVLHKVEAELSVRDEALKAQQVLSSRKTDYEKRVAELDQEQAEVENRRDGLISNGAGLDTLSLESAKLRKIESETLELRDILRRMEQPHFDDEAHARIVKANERLTQAFDDALEHARERYIEKLMKPLLAAAAIVHCWHAAVQILSLENNIVPRKSNMFRNGTLPFRATITSQDDLSQLEFLKGLLNEQLVAVGILQNELSAAGPGELPADPEPQERAE